MTPFVTRCALAGGLASALLLAIALTASGMAYDADQKALRTTYGSTLAEQLAASAIDPLLANEALRLTSLTQEMSHLSGVAWAALYDLDGRRLAGGEGAPAQAPAADGATRFQQPLIFGREALGKAVVALPTLGAERQGPTTTLAVAAGLIALFTVLSGLLGRRVERRLHQLRQRLEAKLGRTVPPADPLQALIQLIDPPQQIVRAPAHGKAPEAPTLEGDEDGAGDERQDQAYLLVINLFNQSQLSPQARQTLLAQLGQALDGQLAGTPGRRGFLAGTGMVVLLPQSSSSLDPALEAIQRSLTLQRSARAALADGDIPAELRFGLERLEDEHAATANPETLLTTASEAVYRTITLAALARAGGLVIGDAVMRAVDKVGALSAEPVAASALAALGAQDPAWRIADRPEAPAPAPEEGGGDEGPADVETEAP